MVGNGLGRGEKTTGQGRVGFSWQAPSVKRWGTSMVHEYLHDQSIGNTDAFATRFSIAKTAHEAQAARGDSGGAAFAYLEDRWQLVGIILAVDNHTGQPDRSAVYGNRTMIADLARYKRFIQSVTDALSD
jgi:secreted trypsin-like serine protease